MPLFAIQCLDKPDSLQLRLDTRALHLEHLDQLGDRAVAIGPVLDGEDRPIGSIIIAAFDDLDSARKFAQSDPYNKAGLFVSVAVNGWRKVLPAA